MGKNKPAKAQVVRCIPRPKGIKEVSEKAMQLGAMLCAGGENNNEGVGELPWLVG